MATRNGYGPYRTTVPHVLGGRVDFAQLVKTCGPPKHGTAAHYSFGQVIDTKTVVIIYEPIEKGVCTSHSERQKLTMRMSIRRITRLTNAQSKVWENRVALGLYFAYYNFCQVHT
jgi:hypothetical protein